jgi:chorismate synthase
MNTFGHIFRLTTFGESHGPAIGGVIDGCPAGLRLDFKAIQHRLALRSPQNVAGATKRNEADKVEFLSGIYEGKTLGTPIAFFVRNKDVRSEDYAELQHIYRPGHADYTYDMRYGIRDYRGGGRASARTSVVQVVAGAIAEQYLATKGVSIETYVDQIGPILLPDQVDGSDVDSSPLRCPDKFTEALWLDLLEQVREEGDSIGGAVRCEIKGVPAGVGEPIFNKVQADLAAAMMSIPAAKGFEYGLGMSAASAQGTESNDEMLIKKGKVKFNTNRAGGLLGGITTGEPIYFRVAFKPVSSISQPQRTVTDAGQAVALQISGRHDVCVAPRAVAIVRAMAAITIMDQMLSK